MAILHLLSISRHVGSGNLLHLCQSISYGDFNGQSEVLITSTIVPDFIYIMTIGLYVLNHIDALVDNEIGLEYLEYKVRYHAMIERGALSNSSLLTVHEPRDQI